MKCKICGKEIQGQPIAVGKDVFGHPIPKPTTMVKIVNGDMVFCSLKCYGMWEEPPF